MDTTGRTALIRIDDAAAYLLDVDTRMAAARDAAAGALLSVHAGAPVVIARRASGRPMLAPPWRPLGISLSHRDGLVMTGFSPRHDVGVDAEWHDPAIAAPMLARDHFACGESAWLAGLPAAARAAAFFRLWCAKEAILKATGRGIADGLRIPDLSPVAMHLSTSPAPVAVALPGIRHAIVAVWSGDWRSRRAHAALALLIDNARAGGGD